MVLIPLLINYALFLFDDKCSLPDGKNIYSIYIYIYLLSGQVLDIVKNLTTELRLASLNNILSTLVEEIYILHEEETWAEDIRYKAR